ncbi:small-subunit processome [Obelidium mucronatum]|nr:small-subunit processome [Obelidium mucronatum]
MKVPSSLRKAAPRKAHKERSQLASRQHLGLLEKKKDYILRATDFKEKKKKLRKMKEKAALKNEDEFYFGMINAKTKKGIMTKEAESRLKQFSHDEMALLKTQDKNYINYQRSINLKKMERLHATKHIPAIEENEDDLVEFDDEDMGEESDADELPTPKKYDPKKANKPNHVIFVDSEQEVQTFDPAKHFRTTPDLLKQRHNRVRVPEGATTKPNTLDGYQRKQLKELTKLKEQAQRELKSREIREEKLRKVHMEMELQQQMRNNKGAPPMRLGRDGHGLRTYKWKPERKR